MTGEGAEANPSWSLNPSVTIPSGYCFSTKSNQRFAASYSRKAIDLRQHSAPDIQDDDDRLISLLLKLSNYQLVPAGGGLPVNLAVVVTFGVISQRFKF